MCELNDKKYSKLKVLVVLLICCDKYYGKNF